MLKLGFWLVLSLIIYTYFIYPLILLTLSKMKSKPKKNKGFLPLVSMVISAHNEESVIDTKIRNCMELDYPKDKLEVMIGSDGSTDKTERIIENYSAQGIRLFKFRRRVGKVNILNNIIPQARGEIIVFSDANTIYSSSAIKELVKHFINPRVGCVCGKLILQKEKGSFERELEGIYWKYESFLKRLEGQMGFLLGANGGIYAIRKELFEPIPSNTIVEDFVISIKILERGSKVMYEPEAIAFEETSRSISEERIRKTRIGAGDYQALLLTLPMLNIFKGFPSFAYWSHKVIRWLVPFLLISLLILNILLIKERFYQYLFILQSIFYIGGLIGYLFSKNGFQFRLFYLLYYFIAMHWSLLIGFLKFMMGTQKVTWEKVNR